MAKEKYQEKPQSKKKRSQYNKKKTENTFRWSQIKYVRPTCLLDDVVEIQREEEKKKREQERRHTSIPCN